MKINKGFVALGRPQKLSTTNKCWYNLLSNKTMHRASEKNLPLHLAKKHCNLRAGVAGVPAIKINIDHFGLPETNTFGLQEAGPQKGKEISSSNHPIFQVFP